MSWQDFAACRDDGRNWFPEEGRAPNVIRELRRVCASCRVSVECLEWALEFERGFDVKRMGVFGGLTPSEREQLARAA